jgi:hypothetical protein
MIADSIQSNSSTFVPQGGSPASVKFSLYVKTQEIKQIAENLERVLLMPRKERVSWVQEHQDMVQDLLDSFVNDSVLALDGLQLDSEAMKLSVDFITNLRDAINTVQGILRDYGAQRS